MAARRRDLREQLAGVLGTKHEFVWELGCGHGHFLTAYAHAHPKDLCIGIDLASDRVSRAIRKRNRASLGNLYFLQAEARLFLENLPSKSAFNRLFILFPDPWPKLRHHKNRIINADFLAAAARNATEGARLYFRTDHESYFLSALTVISTHRDWSLVDEPWGFEHPTVFQSRASKYQSLVAAAAGPRP